MKSKLPALCLFLVVSAFSLRGLGQGVTTPSFGPSAVTESFENIPIGENNLHVGAANGGRSVLVTPFTFRSGIRLIEPDPNRELLVELDDANKGFVSLYTCPTQVTAADIPDGAAYLGEWNTTPLTFTFPVLAEKVGMYVEGSTCTASNTTITLTAYNAANQVIGTVTTQATGSNSNWKNHFIGFNSTTDGIAKITLTGPPIVIDKLTFEKQQECLTTPTFGSSAISESFEGIATSSTNPVYSTGYTKPVTPFTFPSGITLTEPNPNTSQVLIGDWAKGSALLYRCDGSFLATAADVPDGTAFLSLLNTTSTLTFTLPAPSSKVGLYIEGIAGTCVSSTTITLTAYNAANEVIGSCTTAATDNGSNWKNHFLGFRSLSDGITKITLSGPYIDIDKLTFEPIPCVQKTWYLDADDDGYYVGSGVTSCASPGADYKNTGMIADGDCDDNNAQINPATVWYLDNDNDGYYTGTGVTSCTPPGTSYKYTGLSGGNDCEDADATVWQSNVLYIDEDGDGYDNGTTNICYGATVPQGYNSTTLGSDCDDTIAGINPATVWYLDYDNDGYYTGTGITSCTSPDTGYRYSGLFGGGDCADGNGLLHPGATEVCGNGVDENCDGQIDENCTVNNDLSINDVSVNEGNKGRSNINFTVTLNKASSKKVTVRYTTQNGSAMAGSDYAAKSGTVTFKPNSTKQTVVIPILGDKTVEPNETFGVILSNPVNAGLSKPTGIGSIVNDDGMQMTTMMTQKLVPTQNHLQSKLQVTVLPNPSHSYFTLHIQSGSDKPLLVTTVDVLGRKIETKNGVPAHGTLMLGGNYRPGIYFTEVLQGNERILLKLIKQSN